MATPRGVTCPSVAVNRIQIHLADLVKVLDDGEVAWGVVMVMG